MKHESPILEPCLEPWAPKKLKKTQEWFASILSMPIDEDSRMNPISPSGDSMEVEAFSYIVPSPYLKPSRRIELYTQQYWWRLLSVMQDALPLVTRLFGYHDFNKNIAKPYLVRYWPNTWSLNSLADRLPDWIEKEYHAKDKPLVYDAACVDTALNISFFAAYKKTIDSQSSAGDLSHILLQKLQLQPHVFLFDFRYDLFEFRKEMLKEEVEYWMTHDFPKMEQDKRYYFVVYRNHHNNISWEKISASAFQLLSQFSQGTTIEQACEWLEKQDEDLYSEAVKNLHLWFQEWIFRQWLCIV